MVHVTPRARLLVLSVALASSASGCRRSQTPPGEAPAAAPAPAQDGGTPSVVTATPPPAHPRAEVTPDASVAVDPAHPPIDCPLRVQGVDPTHGRPFEDMQKYIAFLERADRAAWQKPDDVVTHLGLAGNETVLDLGAGSGYFSFRLARALPGGRVIAADTEAEMIRHVHHRAMSEGVRNVQVRLISADEPPAAAEADLVFVCDVLHHVADRPAWLSKLATTMKPGARLALLEFKEGKLPEGPPEAAKISRAQLIDLVSKAGLVLDREHQDLLPYQVFLIFKKP